MKGPWRIRDNTPKNFGNMKERRFTMKNPDDFFGRILSCGPSPATLFLVLSTRLEEGRAGEVIQGCLKALQVHPDDIRLRKLLAEAYMHAGFIGLAEEEFSRVVSEVEGLASAYKSLGRMLARQNRADEAIEILKRYLTLNPGDAEAMELLDSVISVQGEAAPVTDKFVAGAEAPYSPDGTAAGGAEPLQEALPEMPVIHEPGMGEKAGGPDPETGSLPEYAGSGAGTGLAPETEKEQLETAVDLATPTLAELYYSQGRIREAIEIYEKILLNQPGDETSRKRLAELTALDDHDEKPLSLPQDPFETEARKTIIGVLENWLTRIREIAPGRVLSNH